MIAFGTSGWRAILADDFTFANVRLVTHAIADELQSTKTGGLLLVGYDPRFMAEKFVAACAEQLASRGFDVQVTDRDTPTPTLSVAIRATGARGGINFTASHNPPEYGGMKFSTANGAPALPEVTKRIEIFIQRRLNNSTLTVPALPHGQVESVDLREMYLAELAKKVNGHMLRHRPLRVAYDALWGTGRGYLDKFLKSYGWEVVTLHDWRDPYFGGRSPEPSEPNLDELKAVVLRDSLDLGLATDGDADRFGIIDRDGTFIPANAILALLTDYLYQSRGWKEGVGRSVATSHWLDRVAAKHSIPVYETPVGFKFLGELILEEKIFLAGEESAGLSIRGHIPEKDGILACLLVAEMVAQRGQPIGAMLTELAQHVGHLVNRRIGVRLTPDKQQQLRQTLEATPPESFGGKQVVRIDRTDGVKFFLEDEAWVLIRLSGTEPLARCYAEARTEAEVEVLLESGKSFIHQ
ncbi:MAG: phosphoglucomutase/phosphomannomutase family protein [Acidobacteriota bacterium]